MLWLYSLVLHLSQLKLCCCNSVSTLKKLRVHLNSFSCVKFHSVLKYIFICRKFALFWALESVLIAFRVQKPDTENIVSVKWHKIRSYVKLVRKKNHFSTMGRKEFLFPLVFTLLRCFWKCLPFAVTFISLHQSFSCLYQHTRSFSLDRKIYRSQKLHQGNLLETGAPALPQIRQPCSSLSHTETSPK